MKKSWKKIIGVTLLVGSLYISTASANSPIPGSVEDPAVAKSYVDEQIAKLKAELGQGGSGTSITPGSTNLVVELLTDGQILLAEEGTEMIVRTGHVVGISSNGNGIPDLTAGTDIKDAKIPHNHLLLFPRKDGRGVKVVQGPSHIMIRGAYEIVDPTKEN